MKFHLQTNKRLTISFKRKLVGFVHNKYTCLSQYNTTLDNLDFD